MDGLLWSDDLLAEAASVREEVERALGLLGVPGELVLTGALSVAGALTRGDVDLHLRVEPQDFESVVACLRAAYPVGSPQSWAATLAVFEVPGPRPTGLAVTPVDSEHDLRFRRAWEALRRDPGLLAKYNALKAASTGTEDYEAHKSRFFSSVTGD